MPGKISSSPPLKDSRGESRPIRSDRSNIYTGEKLDKIDTFNSISFGEVNNVHVKNLVSQVPKNCWFEFELIIDARTREIFKSFRNTKTNEFIDLFLDVFLPDDQSNAHLKVLAHKVTGLNQTNNTRQVKILNREWTLPKGTDFDDISVSFYDKVYQYNTSGKILKYFNLSEFFKIWMDNMYILDNEGKPITTRMRYFRDYVCPKVKVYQYFPVVGSQDITTPGQLHEEDTLKYDMKESIGAVSTDQTYYEKHFNDFHTSWRNVVNEMENVKDGEWYYNTTFLKTLQKTFKITFVYASAGIEWASELAAFGVGILDNEHSDGDFATETLTNQSQKMMEYFIQYASPDLIENIKNNDILNAIAETANKDDSVSDSDLTRIKNLTLGKPDAEYERISVEEELDALIEQLSDEKYRESWDELLENPEIKSIIEQTHIDMGIEYGVLQKNGSKENYFDSLKDTFNEIQKGLRKSSDKYEVGQKKYENLKSTFKDRLMAFKKSKKYTNKDMKEKIEYILKQIAANESLTNGYFFDENLIPIGSMTGSTGYGKTRMAGLKKQLEQTFYREQQNAFNNIANPFSFDLDDDVLVVKNGELVKESRGNTFPHGKKGFSKVNDTVNKVKGVSVKVLQILALALSAYTFTFSLVDFKKMLISENVARNLDPNVGIDMLWNDMITLSSLPTSSLVPSYPEFFFNYLMAMGKPHDTWFADENTDDRIFHKSFVDFINPSNSTQLTNSQSRFTSQIKLGDDMVAQTPVKEFTFYNMHPTKVTYSEFGFDSTDDLTKFEVNFSFTYFEEN